MSNNVHRRFTSVDHSKRYLVAMVFLCLAATRSLHAQVSVGDAATLQADINAGDTNFVLSNSFSVTSPIYIGTTPASSNPITINGAGNSITGTSEIFFVQNGGLTLSNATLSGNAVGGNGGTGQLTGGGALGAGGAIFVGATANVTVNSVQFANNSATGGSGGGRRVTGKEAEVVLMAAMAAGVTGMAAAAAAAMEVLAARAKARAVGAVDSKARVDLHHLETGDREEDPMVELGERLEMEHPHPGRIAAAGAVASNLVRAETGRSMGVVAAEF